MELNSVIQIELAKLLDATEIPKHLVPEQYKELLSDLELSIIVEMSAELLENLSAEGKKLLEEEHFEGYGSLLLFLQQTSTPEAYQAALEKSVDGVLKDFLTKTAA